MVASPHPRDERRCELAAGDEADNEGAEPQAVVHVNREHRHRETDDEVRYEDHRHDRE